MLFKLRQIYSFRWLSFILSQCRNGLQAPLKLYKNSYRCHLTFWMVSKRLLISIFEKIRSDDKHDKFRKESGFRNKGTSRQSSFLQYEQLSISIYKY